MGLRPGVVFVLNFFRGHSDYLRAASWVSKWCGNSIERGLENMVANGSAILQCEDGERGDNAWCWIRMSLLFRGFSSEWRRSYFSYFRSKICNLPFILKEQASALSLWQKTRWPGCDWIVGTFRYFLVRVETQKRQVILHKCINYESIVSYHYRISSIYFRKCLTIDSSSTTWLWKHERFTALLQYMWIIGHRNMNLEIRICFGCECVDLR
jgi:hypothetical protein